MMDFIKKKYYSAVAAAMKKSKRCLGSNPTAPDPPAEDVDELRKLWKRSAGPKINQWSIDYSYYSPIEHGAPDDRKYPMVIVLAGAIEGIVPGYELQANCLALWTAEEYQSRFFNGHSFLFIARAPEEDKLYWDAKKLVPSLKAAIDDFIRSHPNVDDSRIYLIGWCLGGCGAINLITDAPNSFAASIIICPDHRISERNVSSFISTPVWLMGCTSDEYIPFEKSAGASYRALMEAKNPMDFQLTTYDTAPDVYLADKIVFIKNHNMWANLAEDMEYKGKGYNRIVTTDKNGAEIPTPRAIDWLCSHFSPTPYEFGVDSRAYTFNASHIKKGHGLSFLRAEGIDILIGALVELGWTTDARKK